MNIGPTFPSDVERAVRDVWAALSDELRERALKQERSIHLCFQSAPIAAARPTNPEFGQLIGFGEAEDGSAVEDGSGVVGWLRDKGGCRKSRPGQRP
jgi:hypothetical protein